MSRMMRTYLGEMQARQRTRRAVWDSGDSVMQDIERAAGREALREILRASKQGVGGVARTQNEEGM